MVLFRHLTVDVLQGMVTLLRGESKTGQQTALGAEDKGVASATVTERP